MHARGCVMHTGIDTPTRWDPSTLVMHTNTFSSPHIQASPPGPIPTLPRPSHLPESIPSIRLQKQVSQPPKRGQVSVCPSLCPLSLSSWLCLTTSLLIGINAFSRPSLPSFPPNKPLYTWSVAWHDYLGAYFGIGLTGTPLPHYRS